MSATGRVAVLDVGHGNACVVESATQIAVIDAGRGGYLLGYLSDREITEIDHLILSHGDEDHIGAAYALLTDRDRYLVRNLHYDPEQFRDTQVFTRVTRAAKDAELRHGTQQGSLSRGSILDMGGVRLRVLHPSHSDVSAARSAGKANELSTTVLVESDHGGLVLLPGDCEQASLTQIMEYGQARGTDTTAKVLVFPHHGSATSANGQPEKYVANWLALTAAEIVIFSVVRGSEGATHPDPRVVEAVRRAGVHIACTQLSARCSATPPSIPTTHAVETSGRRPPRHHPCAGSVVLDLATGSLVRPLRAAHSAFVDATVSPMCRAPAAETDTGLCDAVDRGVDLSGK